MSEKDAVLDHYQNQVNELLQKLLRKRQDINGIRRNIDTTKELIEDERASNNELKFILEKKKQEVYIYEQKMSDFNALEELKTNFSEAKKINESDNEKINELLQEKSELEGIVANLRSSILQHQEQIREAETAIQQFHEIRLRLEDENKIMKRNYQKYSSQVIRFERDINKKNGDLEFALDEEKRLKEDNEKLERKLFKMQKQHETSKKIESTENNEIEVVNEIKESKEEWVGLMKKKQKLEEKILVLKKNIREELLATETKTKKIYRLEKEIQKKHTSVTVKGEKLERIKKMKVNDNLLSKERKNIEKELNIISYETSQYQAKMSFNSQLQKHLEVLLAENLQLKQSLKDMKESNVKELEMIKTEFAKEKQNLDLEPLFDKLKKRKLTVQLTVKKLIQTEEGAESILTCLNCMQLFGDVAPRVLYPCGHVFCSECLRDVTVCWECKRPIEKHVYVQQIDLLAAKIRAKKQSLLSLLNISKKRIIPRSDLYKSKDNLWNQHRNEEYDDDDSSEESQQSKSNYESEEDEYSDDEI